MAGRDVGEGFLPAVVVVRSVVVSVVLPLSKVLVVWCHLGGICCCCLLVATALEKEIDKPDGWYRREVEV